MLIGGMHIPKSIVFKNINRCINWGAGGGGVGEGGEQIVLWEFQNSQLQVELCPVTNQVAFYSSQVRLNGSKLDLKNVRYLQESGVYQCITERRL